jgi:hypothetical protein
LCSVPPPPPPPIEVKNIELNQILSSLSDVGARYTHL